jgi:hypothetical protein
MTTNYQMAEAGLAELDRQSREGREITETEGIGTVQARASLAAADSSDAVLKALELSNVIAYAQLCRAGRDGAKAARASRAAEDAMAKSGLLPREDEESF